jgi:hypothetical protein
MRRRLPTLYARDEGEELGIDLVPDEIAPSTPDIPECRKKCADSERIEAFLVVEVMGR